MQEIDIPNHYIIATSSIHCKQIIKTVVLSEKLTNIECPNEETGGIQPISMASKPYRQSFSFYHFVPIISTFYNNKSCHNAL